MAVKSFGYDHSLVQEDYYQADLDYQQQYDKVSNANTTNLLQVKHRAGSDELMLETVVEQPEALSGTVLFFRPSDKRLDFEVPIQMDANGQQGISLKDVLPGRWRIKIDYFIGEKTYFTETDLVI